MAYQLLAIIGGTGLTALQDLEITRREMVSTPYGEPSGPLTHGKLFGYEIVFLARHGYTHTIPPHRVNYRANLWALHHIGADAIVAVAAVGGITSEMAPGNIAFPDQIIDYTWSRPSTFFEEGLTHVTHVDFTYPYDQVLREKLIQAARQDGLDAREYGIYGATQGPRLETAAEITRMERDGCDLVGMTGMPEAVLARELEISYATCAVIVNWAAGKSEDLITMASIQRQLAGGMSKVKTLLAQAVPMIYL